MKRPWSSRAFETGESPEHHEFHPGPGLQGLGVFLALDESIGAGLSVKKSGYRPKFRAIVMADLEGGNHGRDSYKHINGYF